MHKLMHKGLKKKKKSKKGKKGEDDEEFDPEELERYRRERAEAQGKALVEGSDQSSENTAAATGSDEWLKFQALTAGVDSILKKTQGDLDRIKSTSFFQRKTPVVEEKKPVQDPEVEKNKAKRFVGFDKDGNPIEQSLEEEKDSDKKSSYKVSEEGFVDVPDDDDDDDEISAEEDIFDTTYIDVLQNTDIQLAYIPDSPTEEEAGDDPFDTTNADKVLKTVDKYGKKVVSLGNAVEVLSGRIDHVSTCKISRPRKTRTHDLLLDDADVADTLTAEATPEPVEVEKTLLDDDTDLPDIPIDITKLPPIIPPRSVTPEINGDVEKLNEVPLDLSEFEVLKEKTILQEIPDLDDDFDLEESESAPIQLEEAEDPFAEKEPEQTIVEGEIIEASFEAATFVNEEDPFDTTFAENLVPGKTELKFIEKELEELPESEVSISLTDPAGLNRDYETGLLKPENRSLIATTDLLGGSATDLSQLADQPIAPVEEITYVDPFDTSGIKESAPGHVELKFLEKELLGDEKQKQTDSLDDDDFDPRKEEEIQPTSSQSNSFNQAINGTSQEQQTFKETFESDEVDAVALTQTRKPSRPEVLGLGSAKSVAFDLPTPSQRPDLLITSDEEKSIPSKPLTPYYSQKSLEEVVVEEDLDDADVDPFDTSFVSKVTPGKTELKLIESELLKQDTKLTHSISDQDFNPRNEIQVTAGRRQSDFGTTSIRPKNLKLRETEESLLEDSDEAKSVFEINEAVHRKKPEPKRQESILDTEIDVNHAKALTPTIETKVIDEEEDISYVDPFDTSIASNILPGKAELKLLENELSQIPARVQPIKVNRINFNLSTTTSTIVTAANLNNDDDFDPRAEESNTSQDFLSLNGQDPGDKVLTPVTKESLDESIDPFDTSFASIGPGRTELKLLESELVDK